MKKKLLFLLIAGVALLFPALQTWRGHDSGEISFVQDDSRYVVDLRTGGVVRIPGDGSRVDALGPPAAGPENTALPSPTIVHYFLLGNGSISGLVWDDLNGNSIPDDGEHGLAGVRVYLDNDSSGTFSPGDPAVTSDGNGLYAFSRVKTGARNVAIDQTTLPAGYGFTTAHPVTVELARREAVSDADIGVQDQSGEITGTIWDQTDNRPIAGVLVYLDLNSDNQFSPAEPYSTSSTAGTYLIKGLAGGSYLVRVDNATLQAQYHRTPASGANPTEVTLEPGGSLDASITYLHKATISGVLRDNGGNTWANITLYIDLNGNGKYDAGEPIVRTDAFGHYLFDGLYPGSYIIRIMDNQLPAGYEFLAAPGTIVVGEGENFTADFLTRALPVTITGTAWHDANGNGIREVGEAGLAGIIIYLDGNDNGVLEGGELSALTNASGAYSFTGVEHGDFTIRVEDTLLRKEYIPTTRPNPVHQEILPGQSYSGAWFGYQKKLAPVHTLRYPTRLNWGGDGNLYVSDNANNAVFILDTTLKVTGELKGLARPLAVSTDGVGNIYVGNKDRKNVEVYDPAGNLLRSLGNGSIETPNDLAFDRDNNLYVLDSANDTVLVYDQEGNYRTAIGTPLQIKYAVSLAVGYRVDGGGAEVGELYVADQASCAIHVFALDGTYKKAVGACGTMYTTNWDGLFAGLVAVVTDRYGNIHGLDTSLHVTQVFEPQNGTFLRSYNSYLPENEAGLNLNTDLAIHPTDNRVVVTNVATRNVESVATVPAP